MNTYTFTKTNIQNDIHHYMLLDQLKDNSFDESALVSFSAPSTDTFELVTNRELTTQEQDDIQTTLDAYDGSEAAVDVYSQSKKPYKLKVVENKFIDYCEQLTGLKEKASFDQLNTIITQMLETDPNTATVLSLNLLAIDAEAKREGGLEWWDTCDWHDDI